MHRKRASTIVASIWSRSLTMAVHLSAQGTFAGRYSTDKRYDARFRLCTVFGYLKEVWSPQMGVAIRIFRAQSATEPPLAIS